ncbi:unnamed protein product [Chilo suppressalis]|uniref:Carboxypeptidase n=1 Tax=Chilo suppressalis TaxID=168631 RepID=A0ABN8BAA9_CHISP|nr:hypothetical protein evm_011789 [Chilo suppressalis]CAH0405030.1 unnamed protein product [Chilo suppressalis]
MFSFVLFVIVSTYVLQYQFSTAAGNNKDCLILTPYIKAGNASHARHLSEVDSGNFLGVNSHSGFLTVKEEYNSNLFFWYFPHENQAEVPWIIWLQGGPGISSLFGLFELIGPLKIDDGKVKHRNLTWASDYSLLFVDSPVGAGFSFTDDDNGYTDNEDDVGAQLYELVIQLLQMFPELEQAPLFIAGESYAGKYVPALAIQIHRNQDQNDSHPVNLRGIAIGNGIIDPRSMMHYTELLSVLGLLAGKELDKLKEIEDAAVALLDEGKMVDAANKFNETIEYIKKQSGISIYNFNKDSGGSVNSDLELFVTKPEVRSWIHVGSVPFDLNNQYVYTKMLPDFMNSTKPFIEELLEHYGVMCYSGQLDLLLPYGVTKHTHDQFNWSRRSEFDKAPRKRLRSSNKGGIVGYKRSGGNFVEVLIRHAGHMVPIEVPEVAKFIVDSFIMEYK